MTATPLHFTTAIIVISILQTCNCWIPPYNHQQCNRLTNYISGSASSTTALSMNKPRKKVTKQKRIINDMVNFIETNQQTSIDPAGFPRAPPEDDEPLASFVRAVVKAADMRKAEDIRALRVSKITAVTSFIIVVSGNSRPQNQAISAAIVKAAQEDYGRGLRNGGVPEGTADSGWILLDYGDVMVHIMTPRSRLFYDIEGQWKGGEDMDLSDVLVPNTVVQESKSLDAEDDPFWS